MTVSEKFKDVPVGRLIEWWRGENLPVWSQETHSFLRYTARALSHAGQQGVAFLKEQAVTANDLKQRYLALSVLARRKFADSQIVSHLVAVFRAPPCADAECVNAFKTLALNGLVRIGQYPLARAEVETLLGSDDKWLSAEAMLYLSRAFEREAAAILGAGLESENEIMRGAACSAAGFSNVRLLRDAVENLLWDSNRYVTNSARIGCEMFENNQMEADDTPEYAVCVGNDGYPEELTVGMVYRIFRDETAARSGQLRVWDDSDDDNLYPAAEVWTHFTKQPPS